MAARRRKAVPRKARKKSSARKKTGRKKAGGRRKTAGKKTGRGRSRSRVEEINRRQQQMMQEFTSYGEFVSKSLSEGNLQIQPWVNRTFDLWKEVIDGTSEIMRIYVEDDGKR